MPALDLSKKPSPIMEARAIERYGKDADQLQLQVFAYLVARGESATQAYQSLYVGASRTTSQTESSCLLAHPMVRKSVALHAVGAQTTARSLVPSAVAVALELMADKDVAAGTRLKAAAFIADRGGLPIASELSVSSLSVVHAIYSKHVGAVADAVKALPSGGKGSQLSAPDRAASSARERESWAALMPAARSTPIEVQAVEVGTDE